MKVFDTGDDCPDLPPPDRPAVKGRGKCRFSKQWFARNLI
jgi:hypothetical protein